MERGSRAQLTPGFRSYGALIGAGLCRHPPTLHLVRRLLTACSTASLRH